MLQEAMKEGQKCSNNASALLDKLEKMCTLLKPLNGYAGKFEKVLKLVKRIHGALDNGTKFANNIPKIGKLREILVEKVMPLVLDALETINKGTRKAIDYAEKFLQYKDKNKGFKLLWEIDKKGNVCNFIIEAPVERGMGVLIPFPNTRVAPDLIFNTLNSIFAVKTGKSPFQFYPFSTHSHNCC